jgi:hypothetical protein
LKHLPIPNSGNPHVFAKWPAVPVRDCKSSHNTKAPDTLQWHIWSFCIEALFNSGKFSIFKVFLIVLLFNDHFSEGLGAHGLRNELSKLNKTRGKLAKKR